MMEKLLIRGGHVIDPANGMDKIADVLIEDGKISAKGFPPTEQRYTTQRARLSPRAL